MTSNTPGGYNYENNFDEYARKGGWVGGGGQSEHLFVEILFQQLINCKEYQILKLNNKCTHTTYHIIRVFN